MPSADFFIKYINTEYSAIVSIDWILTGKGEMLKENNVEQHHLANESKVGYKPKPKKEMSCKDCPFREALDYYKSLSDRLSKENDYLNENLNSLRNQDQLSRKQKTA